MSNDNSNESDNDSGDKQRGNQPEEARQQGGQPPGEGGQGQQGGPPPQQGGGQPPQQGGGQPPQQGGGQPSHGAGQPPRQGGGQGYQQGHRQQQQTNTSTGLEENVAAALSYLFGWVTGLIFYLIEDENEYIRFHAMQSILLSVVFLVGYFALWFAFGIFFAVAPGGGILWAFLQLLSLAGLALVVILMIKAYNGEWFTLPVIGEIAMDKAPPSPSQGGQPGGRQQGGGPAGGYQGGGQHGGQQGGGQHGGQQGGGQHGGQQGGGQQGGGQHGGE